MNILMYLFKFLMKIGVGWGGGGRGVDMIKGGVGTIFALWCKALQVLGDLAY